MASSSSSTTPAAASQAAPAEHLLQAASLARLRHHPADDDSLAAARSHLASGPSRIAEAALLVSAWELPEAPKLSALPDSLWGPAADWLFAYSPSLPTEQMPALARHLARRTHEVADWMERNLAAPAVRAAADACLRAPAPPLARIPAELRLPLQEARARVLQRAQGRPATSPRSPRPRAGRALRVGILHARLHPRPETLATLARCAQLDPTRVELHLLALEHTGSALEDRVRETAAALHVLPETLAQQHAFITALDLDCIVFGDDISDHSFPVAHLAQLRVAPLQISLGENTTALSSVDLLLCGELDAPARAPRSYAERLALMPGTALAWDLSADRPETAPLWTRAQAGIADDRAVIVLSAPEHIESTDLARWRDLVRAAPDALLLLVPRPGAALTPLRDALASLALPGLVLHEPAPETHAEFASLIALGNLAVGLRGPAALLALEAVLPLLLDASEAESALLRVAGLDELIQTGPEALAAEAARLASETQALAALRARVGAAMELMPRFADTYALADDFACVLEKAWDELCAESHGRFRRKRDPIRLSTPHSIHPGDLHAEALALLSSGRPERAVPCLLSALQRAGAEPALWHDLARAYRAAGQPGPAIESLEASLRLDERNAAGWRLLCELSAEAGQLDLAREALDLAATLAGDHPELPALRARVGA